MARIDMEEARPERLVVVVAEAEAEHVAIETTTAGSMRSAVITTWPTPSGPVRKPEMLRPGLNGSVGHLRPMEELHARAERVGEHDQVLDAPLLGQRPDAALHARPAPSISPRLIERGGIRHLPAEELHAPLVVLIRLHDHALRAIVHAEGDAAARPVDELESPRCRVPYVRQSARSSARKPTYPNACGRMLLYFPGFLVDQSMIYQQSSYPARRDWPTGPKRREASTNPRRSA